MYVFGLFEAFFVGMAIGMIIDYVSRERKVE